MFTTSYILSQIFAIINYATLIFSYQVKDNRKVLILGAIGCTFSAISFFLLNAYTGCVMAFLAVFRNIAFMIDKKYNQSKNFFAFQFFLTLIIVVTIPTYDGLLSLLPVVATTLYTLSVWIDNTEVYKYLGIPIEVCWLSYHIYLVSIFGIIFEIILFIFVIRGIVKNKQTNV